MNIGCRGFALFHGWIDGGKDWEHWRCRSSPDHLGRDALFFGVNGHSVSGYLGVEERVDVERPRPLSTTGTEQVDGVKK